MELADVIWKPSGLCVDDVRNSLSGDDENCGTTESWRGVRGGVSGYHEEVLGRVFWASVGIGLAVAERDGL